MKLLVLATCLISAVWGAPTTAPPDNATTTEAAVSTSTSDPIANSTGVDQKVYPFNNQGFGPPFAGSGFPGQQNPFGNVFGGSPYRHPAFQQPYPNNPYGQFPVNGPIQYPNQGGYQPFNNQFNPTGQTQYPQSQYPQGQYPQSQYPQGQYPQGQYPQGQYPQNQHPQGPFRPVQPVRVLGQPGPDTSIAGPQGTAGSPSGQDRQPPQFGSPGGQGVAPQGVSGVPISQGSQAASGIPISQGPQGAPGIPISQGPQGAPGIPISQGPQGAPGIPISQGTQGVSGIPIPQDPQVFSSYPNSQNQYFPGSQPYFPQGAQEQPPQGQLPQGFQSQLPHGAPGQFPQIQDSQRPPFGYNGLPQGTQLLQNPTDQAPQGGSELGPAQPPGQSSLDYQGGLSGQSPTISNQVPTGQVQPGPQDSQGPANAREQPGVPISQGPYSGQNTFQGQPQGQVIQPGLVEGAQGGPSQPPQGPVSPRPGQVEEAQGGPSQHPQGPVSPQQLPTSQTPQRSPQGTNNQQQFTQEQGPQEQPPPNQSNQHQFLQGPGSQLQFQQSLGPQQVSPDQGTAGTGSPQPQSSDSLPEAVPDQGQQSPSLGANSQPNQEGARPEGARQPQNPPSTPPIIISNVNRVFQSGPGQQTPAGGPDNTGGSAQNRYVPPFSPALPRPFSHGGPVSDAPVKPLDPFKQKRTMVAPPVVSPVSSLNNRVLVSPPGSPEAAIPGEQPLLQASLG